MTNGAEHAAGMPAGTGSPTVPVTELRRVGAAAAASLPLVVDRCADQLDRHLDANGGGAVAAG